MIIEILKIAEVNKEGFTIEVPTLEHVTTGIVVAHKETQNSFDNDGLQKCLKHALSHDKVVGGWFNEENSKFYYDSCKVFKSDQRAKAIEFGKENDQIAIFDLTNLELIKL